jgi:Transcription factor WhiB
VSDVVSAALVPESAREEWAELTAALDSRGPASCETSGTPDVWWSPADAPMASSVCRSCPVAAECLAYALAADERFGVWGGMTPEERRPRRCRPVRRGEEQP